MGDYRIRLTFLAALYAVTALGVYAAERYRAEHQRSPDWSAVPYSLNGWMGTDARFDAVYGVDPAESSLLRVYSRSSSIPVIAYVGFSGDLPSIMEVHTPELCYPAQGWLILSSGKAAASLTSGSEMVPAQQILVEKDGERRLVRWWYMAGLRPFENRIRYIFTLLVFSSFTGRTDGAVVRLETPISSDGEMPAALRIEEFERDLVPKLAKALPN
jgi:EpsI family protein